MSSFFTSFRPFHLHSAIRHSSSSSRRAARPLKASAMNPYAVAGAAGVSLGAYGLYSRSVRLESAEAVNHDTKRLRFALPDSAQPAGLSLTSAVLTISWPKDSWTPVIRPYTPVNDLNEPGIIELLVKHYPGGKQSTHLHSLKPGDSIVMLRGVPPGYKWKMPAQPQQDKQQQEGGEKKKESPSRAEEAGEHVTLIAGGAGITPIYQLARGILGDGSADSTTRVTLVWGVNTDDDLFLAAELADLERRHPGRLRTRFVVSRPSPATNPQHARGRVTRQVLEDLGLHAEAQHGPAATNPKVYVCGPPPMEDALADKKGGGILVELGYTKQQIHKF